MRIVPLALVTLLTGCSIISGDVKPASPGWFGYSCPSGYTMVKPEKAFETPACER